MATIVRHRFWGSDINPPLNWQENSIEVFFDRDGNANTKIGSDSFDFVLENAQTLINHSRTNILEAIPFEILVERNGVTEKPYDGYIDLTKDALLSPDICKVKGTELKSIEWLEEKADGFTFEYLASLPSGSPGRISPDDYKFIPYVLNSIPDYKEAAIALLSAYVVYQQIAETIEKIKEVIAEISSGIGSIAGVLKAALIIAYIITLLAAAVKLIKDITQLIIQPVKYHSCMSVKTLLEKGCEYLGLTLSSSILNSPIFSKAFIMPEKSSNPVNLQDKRILGFTIAKKESQPGYFKGTFGDLIRSIKQPIFNGKLRIINNVLYLERKDFGITPPQFILPDIKQPEHGTNAGEFKANYYIAYQTDTLDKNTLQEYTGTAYQVIFTPTNGNTGLSMMKGLEEVRIPFALAKRKTELSVPEKIIKAFLDGLSAIVNVMIEAVNGLITGINAVIGVINNVINALDVIGININFNVPSIPTVPYLHLGNIIENRINMLKLETDFTSVPKIFCMDVSPTGQNKFNKLTANNEIYFSAKYSWENYHIIESWVPTPDRPNGNQYITKNFQNVRFGFQHYQQVKLNNQILVGSSESLVESFKWKEYDQVADISVRISTLLTNNITAKYLEPNGQ